MSLSIHQSLCLQYEEGLLSIENKVRAQPITRELREKIVEELDRMNDQISHLEEQAARVDCFAQARIQELRNQAIVLYGEIEDRFHEHQIDQIREETKILSEGMPTYNRKKLLSIIHDLTRHIEELLASYSPILKERRVIALARMVLEQSEKLLRGAGYQPIISQEDCLTIEAWIEEIAESLHQHNRKRMEQIWALLTQGQRKLLLAYLGSQVLVDLFDETEDPPPCLFLM